MMKEDSNGIRPLIKWELLWLIIQFVVLVSGIIFSYASTQTRLSNLESSLNAHIAQHSSYLRVDVWETRNKFIDEKLDRIEAKLDQLVAHDLDRIIRK